MAEDWGGVDDGRLGEGRERWQETGEGQMTGDSGRGRWRESVGGYMK